MRRLRIGYLTVGSSRDVSNWSGVTKHIRDAFEDFGHEVHEIEVVAPRAPIGTRLRGWHSRFILGKPYGYDRDVMLARRIAKAAERKIATLALDCIVSAQTYPATMLRTDIPTASWCDATFHALMTVYPGFSEISADSIRQGHYLERNAIHRNCLLVYASLWAADDAVSYYGADPAKVAVVPFGANCLPAFDSIDEAEFKVIHKSMKPFRMLFVGRDWERKGGPLAVSILTELTRRGVDAELWVVGCDPFGETLPPRVKCFGLLDKSQSRDLLTWRNCFSDSHVLLVPTRAECFGVVFAEAAAFALPSIATDVGGVADAVADKLSGFLFTLDEGPKAYADLLEQLATNDASYRDYALSAYRHYSNTLNWRTATLSFTGALLQRLAKPNSSVGSRFRVPSSRLQAGTVSFNSQL